jgi:Protein of unknown function (DUF707)
MYERQSCNLVIVRAGDHSLHPIWISGPDRRDWDCIVSYFGDDPNIYRGTGVFRIDSKGLKWPALHQLITEHWDFVSQYDYVWLPDDDLAATTAEINRLFGQCRIFGLALAQPSLTSDSFVSHRITMHDDQYLVRFTNFVEIMAPCFTRKMLSCVRDTFAENRSGWGLDYLWPYLADDSDLVGIIDSVQVRHTRPVGGPNDEALRRMNQSPFDDLRTLLESWSIEGKDPRVLGCIRDPMFRRV